MSFKAKKWGAYGQIDLRDLVPTASYTGLSGTTAKGILSVVGGRVLVCAYDEAQDNAIFYALYDPVSHSWDGPHYPPDDFGVNSWQWYSYFYSDSVYIWHDWGNMFHCVVAGANSSQHWGHSEFFAWAPDGSFHYWKAPPCPEPDAPELRGPYHHIGLGIDSAGYPTRIVRYSWGPWHPYLDHEANIAYGPGGERILYSGPIDLLYYTYNNDWFKYLTARVFGPYIRLSVADEDCAESYIGGGCLFTTCPEEGEQCARSFTASFPSVYGLNPGPTGGAYGTMIERFPDGSSETKFVAADAPTTEIAAPWGSTWNYRRLRDGGAFPLSDGDLDGISHGVADSNWYPIENGVTPKQHPGDGLYTAVNTRNGITPTVYRLDPYQPRTWAPKYKPRPGTNTDAWAGNVSIRPTAGGYVAQELFPPPGKGVDSSRCPVEMESGEVISAEHIWKPGSTAFVHQRALSIDLQGYPTGDHNWWWVDGDPMEHLLALAVGPKRLMIGRYPDYMFGSYSPLGTDVRYGIGAPEPTGAQAPAPSHIMQNSDIIAGTKTWADPPGYYAQQNRRHLVSDREGRRYYYSDAWLRAQQFPQFTAVVGHMEGDTWTTLFDVADLEPTLGQDGGYTNRSGWTIWSLNPIPSCRALPQGGFLVGATLYFAPWGSSWEWDSGSRDATFTGTDKGYVPALPDYEGPYPVEPAPVLRTALDEWSANRSVYGSDALLVYDHEGQFVSHLNADTMHAVDGRYVVVTQDRAPKVIYRLYRYGAYSDYGEQYGAIVDTEGSVEANVPALAVYDLETPDGRIAPGGGTWRGWVDWTGAPGTYTDRQSAIWGWLRSSYNGNSPRTWWGGRIFPAYRPGLGGRSITPLTPGSPLSRGGVRGVGSPQR